jgi:hypothetical protein
LFVGQTDLEVSGSDGEEHLAAGEAFRLRFLGCDSPGGFPGAVEGTPIPNGPGGRNARRPVLMRAQDEWFARQERHGRELVDVLQVSVRADLGQEVRFLGVGVLFGGQAVPFGRRHRWGLFARTAASASWSERDHFGDWNGVGAVSEADFDFVPGRDPGGLGSDGAV